MLKHIVMWQFKDEAEGRTREENCLYVKAALEALPSVIPYIRNLEVHLNGYPSSMGADMVLITEFDSKEDLDLYAVHPEHMKVSEYVGKVRTSRMVCDWES
ncbi:Dabb family protein [Treponema zuelzerae]|uniref:Dabb family protein n=1 Tax=Teretinema zuelzerae TaxID=156 RepID=A0AAE3EGS9_9SPIR|nr:Dabb family protein [Teretinema zuelzerae]MCD1653436.1 Dabb family protein [Teretinema zuelzerae]HQL34248.1 Dabb family protein [Treponemataceae bacterium]